MLRIHIFEFNNFGENTYLAVDSDTKEAAVIDPGMFAELEKESISGFIKDNGIKLTQIILTHAHLDHCFGADYVKNKYGVPMKAHLNDVELAETIHIQAQRFGMGDILNEGLEVDVTLTEGDIINIGKSQLEVIHVPGHSKGGIVLYDKADGVAFVGDSIFEGSIGRTDLPGGDYDTLISSLKNKVLTLPDDTVLLPGHGRATTVGNEKRTNPFLR